MGIEYIINIIYVCLCNLFKEFSCSNGIWKRKSIVVCGLIFLGNFSFCWSVGISPSHLLFVICYLFYYFLLLLFIVYSLFILRLRLIIYDCDY